MCRKEREVQKAGKGKGSKEVELDGKGIYVGESSRSLYERAKEHVADREGGKEDSHQLKHWLTSHQDQEEPPAFRFKIFSEFIQRSSNTPAF